MNVKTSNNHRHKRFHHDDNCFKKLIYNPRFHLSVCLFGIGFCILLFNYTVLFDLPNNNENGYTEPQFIDISLLGKKLPSSSNTICRQAISKDTGERLHYPTANQYEYNCPVTIFFIGVSKSGTTSLSVWLETHPLLQYYFSVEESNRLHNLVTAFWKRISPSSIKTTATTATKNNKNRIINNSSILDEGEGEKNGKHYYPKLMHYKPNDLYDEFALKNMKKLISTSLSDQDVISNIKIIVLIREPVSRLLSQYNHKVDVYRKWYNWWRIKSIEESFNDEFEFLDKFEDCLAGVEPQLLDGTLSYYNFWVEECPPSKLHPYYNRQTNTYNDGTFHFIGKSLYYYYFKAWMELLPASQFMIIDTEKLKKLPFDVYMDILHFIDVPIYDPLGKIGYQSADKIKSLVSRPPENVRSGGYTVKFDDILINKLHERLKPHHDKFKNFMETEYHQKI